jgi:uncharacterized protein (UPF0548 family)
MRPSLFARIDEAAALDDLRHREVNYDPAQAPEDGHPEGHWHVDSGATLLGQEPPGDPVQGGPWEMACQLVSRYEFADERILRAVYRIDQDLLGRDMLLEGRFYRLRFYFGVRVTGVFDETRDTERGQERVWGWGYQTLQGHLEQGRINFEVIKNLKTGQIAFRVTGYSRQARITDPLVRFGFRLFGRWMQQRYYAAVQGRLYHLIQRAQQGEPPPEPTVQSDGLTLAPSAARPHALDRLAVSWVQPGP